MPAKQHDIFRTNVRRRLAEKGMRQRELATRLDVTDAYVSQILSGRSVPGLEVIEKIAGALETTPQYLLMPADPDVPINETQKTSDQRLTPV